MSFIPCYIKFKRVFNINFTFFQIFREYGKLIVFYFYQIELYIHNDS